MTQQQHPFTSLTELMAFLRERFPQMPSFDIGQAIGTADLRGEWISPDGSIIIRRQPRPADGWIVMSSA